MNHNCVDKSNKILKLSSCNSKTITGQNKHISTEYHTPQDVRMWEILRIPPTSLRESSHFSHAVLTCLDGQLYVPIRKKTNHLVSNERNGKPFTEMHESCAWSLSNMSLISVLMVQGTIYILATVGWVLSCYQQQGKDEFMSQIYRN